MKRKANTLADTATTLKWVVDGDGRTGWELADSTVGADGTKQLQTTGPMPIETAVEMLAAENDENKLEAPTARKRINTLFSEGVIHRLKAAVRAEEATPGEHNDVTLAISQSGEDARTVRQILADRYPEEKTANADGMHQVDGAWIHETADVAPKAKLETGVRIGANSTIGAVKLGKGTWIGAGVRMGGLVQTGQTVSIGNEATIGLGCQIKAHASIGKNVVIGHGARIGRFATIEAGAVIGDDATISDWSHVHEKAQVKEGATVDTMSATTGSGQVWNRFKLAHVQPTRPTSEGE